ncbi:hypothetical protein B0I37DRAFT_87225 [Chaetomium sp. MPI-CAGE-AT-0009]|nr:hypothetical protein B0I37DRAFT_87225 [Chaetomium sp. MPI-CAGE-AT-0009]
MEGTSVVINTVWMPGCPSRPRAQVLEILRGTATSGLTTNYIMLEAPVPLARSPWRDTGFSFCCVMDGWGALGWSATPGDVQACIVRDSLSVLFFMTVYFFFCSYLSVPVLLSIPIALITLLPSPFSSLRMEGEWCGFDAEVSHFVPTRSPTNLGATSKPPAWLAYPFPFPQL